MILSDFHLHSAHSDDSEEPMERLAERAIALGLREICLTEHYDMDFNMAKAPGCEENGETDAGSEAEEYSFELDTGSYYEHYLLVREKYGGQLKIRFGVEYGLQPHLKQRSIEYLNAWPFDFVIGSSHLANGKDPYLPYYFRGRSEREAYLEYFESELECVETFDNFDVYGHLDYVVRYGPNRDRFFSYKEYSGILDEILKRIIEKGKGIEVNSGGFANGLDHPNPREDILRRYRELGGEIITIGSDAHKAERVAFRFDSVEDLLKSAGFKYYTVFADRKPEFIAI